MEAVTLDAGVQHELLEASFALAPVGVGFFDSELRCLRANDAFGSMAGVPADDTEGRTPAQLWLDAGPRLEALLRLTLESGRPRRDVELTTRHATDPGTTQHWVASAFPIPGDPHASDWC